MSQDTVTVGPLGVASWGPSSPATYGASANKNSTTLTDVDEAKRTLVEKRLWWWNLTCAIAHLVQAAAALAIGERTSHYPRTGYTTKLTFGHD